MHFDIWPPSSFRPANSHTEARPIL